MKSFFSFLSRMFGISKKSEIDKVLATLNKPLAELKALQERHTKTIAENAEEVAKLNAESALKNKEKDRAAKVYSNISTLLAVDEAV